MSHKTPINLGVAQSDIDLNNKQPDLADLSAYAGANLTWNAATKKFDASEVASVMPGVFANVTDAPYNATGDGVTDDTVAIITAITAVSEEGGGTVFFPKGVYLCNGDFLAGYNSILPLPIVSATGASAYTIQLLGEVPPCHTVGFAFDNTNCATIKTTKTAAGLDYPALLAGNSWKGPGPISYDQMNNIRLILKNLFFQVPDNPTINAVRLEAVGWVSVEDCTIIASGASTEPTHGTTGLWMPDTINFGESWMNRVFVAGFDTGFMLGEHTRAPLIYAHLCKNGVTFLPSNYPSWANIQLSSCVNGITFSGTQHVVDLLVETEHDGSGWWAAVYDINDPDNAATGLVKTYIGNGMTPGSDQAFTLNGGDGLIILNLFNGDIRLPTVGGADGSHGGGKITGKGTVPPGGTTGQSLKKVSNADYDVGWA